MQKRRGLGHLLLKRFNQSKKRKPLGSKTQAQENVQSLSKRHTKSRAHPILRLSKIQGRPRPPSSLKKKLQARPQPQSKKGAVEQPAQPPVQELVPQVVPATVEVVLAQPPEPKLESTLSTAHLVRPNEKLQQSIEAFLLDQRSPHTRRAYGKDLKRFIQFLLTRNHAQGVESLTRNVVISYKEFLLSEKLQHTSVDRHIATLRSFFKWLVDDGILEKSPAEGVRFLNPKRLSTTIGFSDLEVTQVLAQPDLHTKVGALHYAILMILFYCGLRRSELCELKTVNVGTEQGQKVLRLRGKGNAERIIVMIPAVWNALKYYFYIARRSMQENQYLFLPLKNNRTKNLDKPLDPSTIFYIVTRYAKRAGISNRVSPHSCRATAISNARDHHVPDRAIQEFAGWASPDMITRYDKRKSSITDSAAHAISYHEKDRVLPSVSTSTTAEAPTEALPNLEGPSSS